MALSTWARNIRRLALKGVKRPKLSPMERLLGQKRRAAEAKDVAPSADVLMKQAGQAEAADAAAIKANRILTTGGIKR